jgi:hypothetical protein
VAAGLPGTGIGGLFFILSAFFMVVVELQRTLRGKSSRARWRIVGRHAAVAATMVAAVTAAIWIVHRLVFAAGGKAGAGGSKSAHTVANQLVPFSPVLITLAVLAMVLLTGYVAKFVFGRGEAAARADTPALPRTRPHHQPAAEPLLATTTSSKH